MENQPTEQIAGETPRQTSAPIEGPAAEQGSSAAIGYIVAAVVIVGLVALWYVYSTPTSSVNTETPTATTQAPSLTSGNTTADISADLNQPDSSSALDADAAATASALQGL